MLWSKLTTKKMGDIGETLAQQYLTDQGLSIIDKNFHCRFGEIDIIATDQASIIFIEVKYRKKNDFGGAISAVSVKKQQKVTKSARIYLQQQQLNEYNTACRFDVVAIDGSIEENNITWIKNAF
jgi:putative endonuclease